MLLVTSTSTNSNSHSCNSHRVVQQLLHTGDIKEVHQAYGRRAFDGMHAVWCLGKQAEASSMPTVHSVSRKMRSLNGLLPLRPSNAKF